jgi:small-conductance mechanosensitive channel/CRP-like cAMP-binding protein
MPDTRDLGALHTILTEAHQQGTAWILAGFLCARVLQGRSVRAPEERRRWQIVLGLMCIHLLLLPATGLSTWLGAGVARDLRLTGSVSGALALVGISAELIFHVVFARLRVGVPRIVQDIIVAAFAVVAVFGTAGRVGVDLSGIIATGAVVTGVIGLALQDLLGNVFGGLSLQLDHTVRVGDWIRVQDVWGRVVEIRWRSTSIETNHWETVIIPNSVLTRSQVVVLGRRLGTEHELPRWRRELSFSVDFRYPPNQVIDCVLGALRGYAIEHVAQEPPPKCILLDFTESSARYTVRYWLTNFNADTSTDGAVYARVYYALKRAEIPLSLPAHAVFLTEESNARRQEKLAGEHGRRMAALARIGLFRALSDTEREELAGGLHYAPFGRGEVITRTGAAAHHLYMVTRGTVSVRTGSPGAEDEVAQLSGGEFFGEMSLLTGAPRSATIVALTDVECYRLDAEAFRRLLERRPDLAEKVAAALSDRRTGLIAKQRPSMGQHASDLSQRDLLDKIRQFFGL